jgi:hypothetical protein
VQNSLPETIVPVHITHLCLVFSNDMRARNRKVIIYTLFTVLPFFVSGFSRRSDPISRNVALIMHVMPPSSPQIVMVHTLEDNLFAPLHGSQGPTHSINWEFFCCRFYRPSKVNPHFFSQSKNRLDGSEPRVRINSPRLRRISPFKSLFETHVVHQADRTSCRGLAFVEPFFYGHSDFAFL